MRGDWLLVAKRRAMTRDYFDVGPCDAQGVAETPWVSAGVPRVSVRTKVCFLAEDSGDELFSFKSQRAVDLGGGYDVYDDHGLEIAQFGKNQRRRLTVWLKAPGMEALGRPAPRKGARARLLDLSGPFALELVDHVSGRTVIDLARLPGRQESYLVEVADPRVDAKVAAAVSVGIVSVLAR